MLKLPLPYLLDASLLPEDTLHLEWLNGPSSREGRSVVLPDQQNTSSRRLVHQGLAAGVPLIPL